MFGKTLRISVFYFFLLWVTALRSQVIISLIFGEKLNSPRIEFGLDGGFTFSQLQGLSNSETMRTFNLGFYFDYKFKNPAWMLNIGEMVVSNMGAEGIAPYPLNDPELDSVFKGGQVSRKLSYFNTTVFLKYKFRSNFFVKLGFQACLMNKAYDIFAKSMNEENDLGYKHKIRDQYKSIDFGPSAGIGYRLMGGNGMNFGLQYYYGVIPIQKNSTGPAIYNRCLYINAGIPVGAAKKKEKSVPEKE